MQKYSIFGTKQYNHILLESAGWIKIEKEEDFEIDYTQDSNNILCFLESDGSILNFPFSSIKAVKWKKIYGKRT